MTSIDFTRRTYFDGGMGTLLQGMGLVGGERPERWNLSRPELVKRAHRLYLDAGAEIIAANTFGATSAHLGTDADALMRTGVKLALEAVREAGHGRAAIDMGSLGKLLQPMGDMPFESAVKQFRDAFIAGIEAGGELILIETMNDQLEAKAAVIAAKEARYITGTHDMPILCSMCFGTDGRLLTGASVEGAAAMLASLRVDAIGINCGDEPQALMGVIERLVRCSPLPVFVSPNASLPEVIDGKTVFRTTPKIFAEQMKHVAELGAWGLGGCCGTTPEHIHELISATRDIAPKAPKGGSLVISGRGACIEFGNRPIVIGERLNPTGKPLMKRALREGDDGTLLREAVGQADAGADALDVNVGLPEIDEIETLPRVVSAVQSVCGLPLVLDTSNAEALCAALRVYNGKPLINSVCGKPETMRGVFEAAARYGGAVIALTLDENGIPATVEGRLDIARRIIAEAEKYGISKNELVFDALTMTVAADADAARVTLETVRALKNRLGVRTVLGVSNVSHGLPQRPIITAAFIALAAESGLDAAIMNPSDRLCRAMLDASAALCGRDAGFERFLGEYSEAGRLGLAECGDTPVSGSGKPSAAAALPDNSAEQASNDAEALKSAVVKGLRADAQSIAERILKSGGSSDAVVDGCIIPAFGTVGELYEKGKLFLPQLLASAAAAQDALACVYSAAPPLQTGSEPVIIIATVKGDVHDIGKGIVKVLLQNYGYSVIDLGRDVPPERIVLAARDSHTRLVGLSALMTTTVPAMRETIAQLRDNLPDIKVMVGGAVLTQEYAKEIGADYYAKDAMAAVRVANEVFGKE